MILNICSDSTVLSIIRIVKIVITILKIAVPIILIVTTMISFVGGVISAEVDKPLKALYPRIIAAILIFMIPTLVSIIVDITSTRNPYYSCLENATSDGIKNANVEKASNLVLAAKNTLNMSYYNIAKIAVENLEESGAKESLNSELSEVYEEIQEAIKEREENKKKGSDVISKNGKYTKTQIIDMSEEQVKNMTNEEFIKFMAAAAQIVYAEYGGVLPSITVAQAILESGYGNSFETTSHNVYGLIGYPGEKPKVNVLRKFDNFYEATYYHYAYFENYRNVYNYFLTLCENNDPISATTYLRAYANGQESYGPTIATLINQYNLTQYD